MADEFDRKMMPDFMNTTLAVSLGAAYKGFEMLLNPMESFPKMVSEMKDLVSIPEDSGDGIQQKMEALAGVWLEKGTHMMADCKSAGEKFTEDK
jgi:hypothetical protein